MVGVGVLALAKSSYGWFAPKSLRLEDVFTENRCVVYTYNEGGVEGDAVAVWQQSWEAAGWTPIVLNEQHAALHPNYQDYRDYFLTLPTPNTPQYELACYLRHAAMSVVGGGLMTDYDVVNVNVPPPPNCDTLPNNGALTTHDNHVPSIISGNKEAYDALLEGMRHTDWNVVMVGTGQDHLSDMIFTLYFGYVSEPRLVTCSLQYSHRPNEMASPPCAEDGTATPMIFHFSHDCVTNAYGGAYRAGVMGGEWERLTEEVKQCKPLNFDAQSYPVTLWKTVEGDSSTVLG